MPELLIKELWPKAVVIIIISKLPKNSLKMESIEQFRDEKSNINPKYFKIVHLYQQNTRIVKSPAFFSNKRTTLLTIFVCFQKTGMWPGPSPHVVV